MTNIVVNYRREDVPAEARRIRDTLAGQIGRTDVVTAHDGSAGGQQLGVGDVLVVVIGPRWLDQMKGHAARGERDDVRAEIAAALRRGLAVIPVRVGRVDAMPATPGVDDLPEDIRALAQRKSRTLAVERFEVDALALSELIRPTPIAATLDRLPGNSFIKLWLWSGAAVAATVLVANLVAYLTNPVVRPTFTQPSAMPRPSAFIPSLTGEGRIRRAIEAALAKGRRPEEARRCQSELIAATDAGTIVFNTASADLDQTSHQTLETLAKIIRSCPDFIIEVEGHTDSQGDPANNQRLSERRAYAVRDYLVRAGVSTASLGAVGYGETRPIVVNDSLTNMARNRRIEFNITSR